MPDFPTAESTNPSPSEHPAIIPAPASIQLRDGSVRIGPGSLIQGPEHHPEFKPAADNLRSWLDQQTVSEEERSQQVDISFRVDSGQPPGGYTLEVDEASIAIGSASPDGAFHGIQSLIQLSRPWHSPDYSGLTVPCVSIADAPAFRYRGLHLDVGRHIYPVAFIKQFIDLLARYKMNRFHWHLTEDQGWRIEIKKYPRLQEVSAFRKETLIGHLNDKPARFDGQPYGGYYTQEEIREVVQYAQDRYVTIIPEIEMPGHAQAAIAAYPELGCTGQALEVGTIWGIIENVYCPSEATFEFLENVLTEVMELFPSEYIHIGGDECPKAQWKTNATCQKLIREHNLRDEDHLQSWFIQRIERFLNRNGRKLIGWDEILEGGLAPNATVMSWRGEKGGIEAARMGHDVIMTPTDFCYFDSYQSDRPGEPLAIGGLLPLEKVYNYNPIPESLSKDEAARILGAQGNVWTEYMKTPQAVEYMVYPRMQALAEVVWTGSKRPGFEDFLTRLQPHVAWMKAGGMQPADPFQQA